MSKLKKANVKKKSDRALIMEQKRLEEEKRVQEEKTRQNVNPKHSRNPQLMQCYQCTHSCLQYWDFFFHNLVSFPLSD